MIDDKVSSTNPEGKLRDQVTSRGYAPGAPIVRLAERMKIIHMAVMCANRQ